MKEKFSQIKLFAFALLDWFLLLSHLPSFIYIDNPYFFNYLISFPPFTLPSLPQCLRNPKPLPLLSKPRQNQQTRCPENAVQPSGTVYHSSQSHFTTWCSASNSSIQASCTLRGFKPGFSGSRQVVWRMPDSSVLTGGGEKEYKYFLSVSDNRKGKTSGTCC